MKHLTAAHRGNIEALLQEHYTNLVRIEAVRGAVMALRVYNCDRAMVITNNYNIQ
jgi:HJR/Mrr/RecB family endonuclease